MSEFTTDIVIDAPVRTVWDVLADIGSIAEWNPGVVASHATSEPPTGAGASRHCDLRGGRYLQESVAEFVEGEAITMRVEETNLPFFAGADIRFRLEEVGDTTRVTCSPDYTLRPRLLAPVVDRMLVRPTYRKGMEALLRGLKRHAEAGARSIG